MSEYQYYEFQAIDRPLDRGAQEELRAISSRARIGPTSFINHYEWGDFKGDPRKLMERWFDLHLYVANWGTRRLMLRLPARLLKRADIDPFVREVDGVEILVGGDNLILDVQRDEVQDDDFEEGSGRLASLAPLRADILSGDLRLFYLLWLLAVQDELVADDELEPLAGIAPMTGALDAFADFLGIDSDLVEAAAEHGPADAAMSEDSLRRALAAIPESGKLELLLRVAAGDHLVAAELKRRARKMGSEPQSRRTVSMLRSRAREIEEARERALAEREEAERRRKAQATEKERRVRIEALKQRGEKVWQEVEQEIERRNPSGYDRAIGLILDLQALAAEDGSVADFDLRLASIQMRHEKKGKFIERLSRLKLEPGARH
jgi:hypothetical protein